MFQKGRRLVSVGSIGLIVIAAIHTNHHLSSNPADPRLVSVISAIYNDILSMRFGMNPTLLEVYKCLSLTMSIPLVWLGLQTLLVPVTLNSSGLLIR